MNPNVVIGDGSKMRGELGDIDLSVVIPTRNEVGNVGTLIAEIDAAVLPCRHEIVIVDDGSDDGTDTLLAGLIESRDRRQAPLRLLRQTGRSLGQSTAIWLGVHAARGQWVVMLDGDGQNDPADILKLLDAAGKLPRHVDFCVIGHRVNRKDTFWKRLQSRAANRVRDAVLHDGVPDTGCALKLLPRATYLQLPYFDHMHRYIPALVRRLGGRVQVVAVNHRERLHGRSNYTAWNRAWVGVADMFGVRWLTRRNALARARIVEWTEPVAHGQVDAVASGVSASTLANERKVATLEQ